MDTAVAPLTALLLEIISSKVAKSMLKCPHTAMFSSFFTALAAAYLAFIASFTGSIKPSEVAVQTEVSTTASEMPAVVVDATTTVVSSASSSALPKPATEIKKTKAKEVVPATVKTTPTTPNSSVPAPAPIVPQVITKLELTNVRVIPSAYSATIKWNTNIPADATLTYWAAEGGINKATRTTMGQTNHQVEVGTDAGTTYYYLVEVTASGQIAASDQKEFTSINDITPPVISSVKLSRTDSAITFKVSATKPVKLKVNYSYQYTQENASGSQSTFEFATDSSVTVPMPRGWNANSNVIYSVTATDKGGLQGATELATLNLSQF